MNDRKKTTRRRRAKNASNSGVTLNKEQRKEFNDFRREGKLRQAKRFRRNILNAPPEPEAQPIAAPPPVTNPNPEPREVDPNSVPGLLNTARESSQDSLDLSGFINKFGLQNLFPTANGIAPNVEDDPLTQRRIDKSVDSLQEQLASRGLSNSGAFVEKTGDIISGAYAEETSRLRDFQQAESNRLSSLLGLQQSADQFESVQGLNIANALTNLGVQQSNINNNQTANAIDLLNVLGGFSTLQPGLAASQNIANITTQQGDQAASILSDLYQRIIPQLQATPGFVAPLPVGPNPQGDALRAMGEAAADVAGINADTQRDASIGDAISAGIGSAISAISGGLF